jgi:hypothetical protein
MGTGTEEQASVPLYQAKPEFFRMLGHPVRIRVLELLQDGPMPVRDLLTRIEIEPSGLSQQLAVLELTAHTCAPAPGIKTQVFGPRKPDWSRVPARWLRSPKT